MKKIFIPGFAAIILFFAQCSTSKITTSWNANCNASDSGRVALPVHLKKILVVGLFENKNRDMRQQMEDQLVQDLNAASFNAVTSVSVYGPQSFQNMNDSEALQKITAGDIDGVIIIELIDQSNQASYVPRTRYYNPVGGWVYHPMWGSWSYRPMGGYGGRGYYQNNASLIFETNLYLFKNIQLVYSAQSQSDATSATASMAKDYSKSIIKDLRENNILH